MNEPIFLVEEADEGGYTARALGESIFTEADSLAALRENVRRIARPRAAFDVAEKSLELLR